MKRHRGATALKRTHISSAAADDATQAGLPACTANGAYDLDSVYRAVIDRDPEALVVVPLRATAVLSETAGIARTQRDRHLQCLAAKSRIR
jgi:hypothetical protein